MKIWNLITGSKSKKKTPDKSRIKHKSTIDTKESAVQREVKEFKSCFPADVDEFFVEAGRFIVEKDKASIGLIQKVFKIGFNRAARIMDQLAEAGVVSEESSTRPRVVLMTKDEFERFLELEYNQSYSSSGEKGTAYSNHNRSRSSLVKNSVFDVQIDSSRPVLRDYTPPVFSLLDRDVKNDKGETERQLKETAFRIQETLRTFGMAVRITGISQGPVFTRFECIPDLGVSISKIRNLSDDLRFAIPAEDILIEAPIPGKTAVGITIRNKAPAVVHLREMLESGEFRRFEGELPFVVGKDIVGRPIIYDIVSMPHLLIAGTTGAGQTTFINTIILSLIYRVSPDKVSFILIDPKRVELSAYRHIPHLLIPVVTDANKASLALDWAVSEMERRYMLFSSVGVRSLKEYNKYNRKYCLSENEKDKKTLQRIVIIIDELADLMMTAKKDVENSICRLTQRGRSSGIHLIISTQRPSVDVITGLIKANIPSRAAFAMTSRYDSRTIIDMAGAEKLNGCGDMLFYPKTYQIPVRVQCAFVSDHEVDNVVEYLRRYEKRVPGVT